eukprot:PLAT3158.1.p1 GENE.PLAT3158.1~~PLAT3158.1.p1  ORF type:complete len:858 (+),score=333.35 PLAT3158.1:360-2576(+)
MAFSDPLQCLLARGHVRGVHTWWREHEPVLKMPMLRFTLKAHVCFAPIRVGALDVELDSKRTTLDMSFAQADEISAMVARERTARADRAGRAGGAAGSRAHRRRRSLWTVGVVDGDEEGGGMMMPDDYDDVDDGDDSSEGAWSDTDGDDHVEDAGSGDGGGDGRDGGELDLAALEKDAMMSDGMLVLPTSVGEEQETEEQAGSGEAERKEEATKQAASSSALPQSAQLPGKVAKGSLMDFDWLRATLLLQEAAIEVRDREQRSAVELRGYKVQYDKLRRGEVAEAAGHVVQTVGLHMKALAVRLDDDVVFESQTYEAGDPPFMNLLFHRNPAGGVRFASVNGRMHGAYIKNNSNLQLARGQLVTMMQALRRGLSAPRPGGGSGSDDPVAKFTPPEVDVRCTLMEYAVDPKLIGGATTVTIGRTGDEPRLRVHVDAAYLEIIRATGRRRLMEPPFMSLDIEMTVAKHPDMVITFGGPSFAVNWEHVRSLQSYQRMAKAAKAQRAVEQALKHIQGSMPDAAAHRSLSIGIRDSSAMSSARPRGGLRPPPPGGMSPGRARSPTRSMTPRRPVSPMPTHSRFTPSTSSHLLVELAEPERMSRRSVIELLQAMRAKTGGLRLIEHSLESGRRLQHCFCASEFITWLSMLADVSRGKALAVLRALHTQGWMRSIGDARLVDGFCISQLLRVDELDSAVDAHASAAASSGVRDASRSVVEEAAPRVLRARPWRTTRREDDGSEGK